jgi:hypothetical protein
MASSPTGHHIVVKDGKFVGLVSELLDGNFVVLKVDQPVFPTKNEAISAALNEGLENKAGEEWLHQ